MAPGTTQGLERVDGSSGHHLRPYQQELLNAALEENVRPAAATCSATSLCENPSRKLLDVQLVSISVRCQ